MKEIAARVFTVGVWLVGLSVLLQVLLAGLGVFTDPSFFFWHAAVNSTVVGLLPLLLVLVGWFAGVPVRIRWLCAAVTGLVVVQSLLLFPYHLSAQGALRAISSLHVLNAIFIFWVALTLLERTRAWSQGGPLVVEEGP
jgi:hypothetical protein